MWLSYLVLVVLVCILSVSDLAIKNFKKLCYVDRQKFQGTATDSMSRHLMTHEHIINSSADLELLVEGDSLTRVGTAGETLNMAFNPYEMNRKDLSHLLLLWDLVTSLSVGEMTVDCSRWSLSLRQL